MRKYRDTGKLTEFYYYRSDPYILLSFLLFLIPRHTAHLCPMLFPSPFFPCLYVFRSSFLFMCHWISFAFFAFVTEVSAFTCSTLSSLLFCEECDLVLGMEMVRKLPGMVTKHAGTGKTHSLWYGDEIVPCVTL